MDSSSQPALRSLAAPITTRLRTHGKRAGILLAMLATLPLQSCGVILDVGIVRLGHRPRCAPAPIVVVDYDDCSPRLRSRRCR